MVPGPHESLRNLPAGIWAAAQGSPAYYLKNGTWGGSGKKKDDRGETPAPEALGPREGSGELPRDI